MKSKTNLILLSALLCLAAPLLLTGCRSTNGGSDIVPGDASNTATVANVAELRLLDSESCEYVLTAGYHTAGDGGSCTYFKDVKMKSKPDNGGTVIVADDGTRWRAIYGGALPLRIFGAVGDGVADDTAAIVSWLGELDEGGCGYATAGKYLFTDAIKLPLKNNIALYGDGSQQTCFIYGGEDSGSDLFTVGSKNLQLSGWTLEKFNIDSVTDMKSGSALRLVNLKHTARLRDVSISRVDDKNGNNLWNGVSFENCSLTDYVGFEINVKNEGIMIAGVSDSDASADILIDQGTITFSRIGIHCGGGFGGLYIGQVLIYGCTETGYLQDNSLVSRGNREIIISDQTVLDACHSHCALIDDPMSLQCTLSFNAFISGAGWIEPATPGTGLTVNSLPQGRISIGSQHIKHCKSHGVELRDASAYVSLSPLTYIVGNAGYGLYSSYGLKNVNDLSVSISNMLGKYN